MSEVLNVAALKQKIIEAGITGKLVPQISSEGTAEELLKQIEAERATLIKEGKIKKEKPLPQINEDEIPFEIPKSWKWVKVNDLVIREIKRGKYPKYVEKSSTLVFAQKCNLKTGGINLKLAYYLDEQLLSKYPANEYLQDGDIVINSTGTGTLGRIGLFLESDRIKNLSVVPDTHVTTVRTSSLISSHFLYYYLKFIQNEIEEMGEGSTNQKELKPISIMQLVIPLPPLSEQKRIVAKIEELMIEIDNIERLQSAYTANQGALKKKIIEAGITGKLVPQIASDGTAEKLLKQIEAERASLIKAGKIKKEKTLPEITEDEIPFEIPKSWKWVRLANIVFNNGQKIPDKRFSYIDIGSIDNVHNKLNTKEQIIEANNAPSRARKIVARGDIIYATVRPYLHNACIIDKDFIEEPIASTGFAVLSCYPSISNKYLFSYLLSSEFDSYANSSENATGTMYPAITDKKLYAGLVPLPPLSEQKRIVAKIEELMQIIDNK